MPDFCQTMSSLEPVLEAQGGRTRSSFTISMPSAEAAGAILICDHEVPGGARRSRTDDILLAKQALYQLSYGPVQGTVRPRRAVGDLSQAVSSKGW